MCWSFEASTAIAVVGAGATAYCVKKGEPKEVWLPLLYFTLMEGLQAGAYVYINQCETAGNQLFTVLSYLHITFQPFFINMFVLQFVPERIRKRFQAWIYGYCGIAALLFLLKLYPFDWAGQCRVGLEVLCGTDLCSRMGAWHLAWHLPLNGLPYTSVLAYTIPVMILPFLYGAWRINFFLLAFGPLLAYVITQDTNEFPAVWCIFSVMLIIIPIFTPLRKYLTQKSWYGK